MLKNFKVTTKLVAILVAPVLVLMALAAVGVRQRLTEASNAKRVQELTEVVGEATRVITQLQLESLYASLTSVTNGTNAEYKDAFDKQLAKTDAAVEKFKTRLADFRDSYGDTAVAKMVDAESALNQGLSVDRSNVKSQVSSALEFVGVYQELADRFNQGVRDSAKSIDKDPELARAMSTVADFQDYGLKLTGAGNYLAPSVYLQRYVSSLPKGTDPVEEDGDLFGNPGCGTHASADPKSCPSYARVKELYDREEAAKSKFDDGASPTQKPVRRQEGEDVAFLDALQDAVGRYADPNSLKNIPVSSYVPSAVSQITKTEKALDKLLLNENNLESVYSIASTKASEAQQQATLYAFGAVASILVAGLITYSVGRSITVPLRKLTGAAYTLSTERLPALVERLRNPEEESHEALAATLPPIDIHSKDEIGQLADSFNSIQQVTIEVAEEQSVLLRKGIGDIFINLARRNQTLLDRQIEFIDQLEANEEDPDQLDNLFKLDHLATRMRRNAESLLVLAGAEPPRRRGRPVALADVVRVAIGEVEDFARIQLLALDEATVGGNVAVDLAHLLSELMENATHFSPPDTMVEIVGHRSDNGYIISVSDQGIGMSAEQLAEANHQLARPPLVGLALSRSLGFIVIGRLAQRFDISVKLTASPSGGVTALVTLPPDLVTYEGEELGVSPSALPQAPPPARGPEPAHRPDDVVVLDRDLTVQGHAAPPVDEPVHYAPPPVEPPSTYPEYQPNYQQPDYQPGYQQPGYQQPDYQPGYQADYQEVAPGIAESDEFERGLQRILGDEGPVPTAPPSPTDYDAYAPPVAPARPEYDEPAAPPTPPRARPEPVMTVAEQIAAASRAETKQAELTAAGLVRRTPKKRADNAMGGGMPITSAPRLTTSSQRSPEEVRKMLSRYRSGLNKGRNSADPERTDS